MFTSTHNDIYHNAKTQQYNNFCVLKISDRNIFREKGWEARNHNNQLIVDAPDRTERDIKNKCDSIARAKRSISDICNLNIFDWFVTLTFDGGKIDRTDCLTCYKKLQVFLMHQSKRQGIKYLIISEAHKDGCIHFHGLIKGEIDLSPAINCNTGKQIHHNSKPVYNWLKWKYGFSTVTQIQSPEAVSKYVLKYITKDVKKLLGRYYYCSCDLVKKPAEWLFDSDEYNDIEGKEIYISALDAHMKIAISPLTNNA